MECSVCGCNVTEKHHIIFRSQATYLTNIPLNFKYLCPEHHRGNYSPHMNKSIDKQYKIEYQKEVERLFNDKEFYGEEDILERLQTTKTEVKKLTKKLLRHKEGYKKEELILRLLGGRYYA